MNINSKLKTILTETFAAPASGSYAIQTPRGEVVVLRQRGTFKDLDLSGADLSGLNLSGITLDHVLLKNANLSGTNLKGSNLVGSDLAGAIVSGAKFDGAALKDVTFEGARFDTPPSGVGLDVLKKNQGHI